MNGKSMRLGQGGRFQKLEKLVASKGAKDPAAVAASISRKKYGNKKTQEMAIAGKHRANK